MARKTTAAAPAADATVLVSTQLLIGGTAEETVELSAGRELTADLQKALGLDGETVAGLVERGVLIERKVRQAAAAGDAKLLAALEAANAEVATLKAENADLARKLAEAAKPAG